MKNCKTCANALFEERWGEYKCSKTQHKIYNPEAISDCENYKKGKPSTAKRWDEDEE